MKCGGGTGWRFSVPHKASRSTIEHALVLPDLLWPTSRWWLICELSLPLPSGSGVCFQGRRDDTGVGMRGKHVSMRDMRRPNRTDALFPSNQCRQPDKEAVEGFDAVPGVKAGGAAVRKICGTLLGRHCQHSQVGPTPLSPSRLCVNIFGISAPRS